MTQYAVALGHVAAQNEPLQFDRTGVHLALAAGGFAGIGAVAFSAGRASIVTTISALYFVAVAVLGVAVLGESLALKDGLGIGFAVLAVSLLAS